MTLPMMYGLSEINALIRFPLVESRMMEKPNIVATHDVPNLAGYSLDRKTIFIDRVASVAEFVFLGKGWNIASYLILAKLVEKAIVDAVQNGGDDKEVQRLLILLKMTDPGDKLIAHARAVGSAGELYAVAQQHGPAGCKAYLQFCASMASMARRPGDPALASLPPTLDMASCS